jgi:hypothetical protein
MTLLDEWDTGTERSDPNDLMLGQIVEMFYEDNDTQAWALCMDIESMDVVHADDADPWDTVWDVRLSVLPHALPRFTGEVADRIADRALLVVGHNGYAARKVYISRSLPKQRADWREVQRERETALAEGVTNQARRATEPNLPTEDGMVFRSDAELRVYRVLKRLQANAPEGLGFTIVPLPLVRLMSGNVYEPDFMIAINRRVGVIEVDGPHHRARRAADTTRERLFRPSGIWMFERVMPEDTEDGGALYNLLCNWLKAVAGQ